MHVYLYKRVYTHVYMCVCISRDVCIGNYLRACGYMFMCAHACLFVSVDNCMCVCMHVDACMSACITCLYVPDCMYVHVYVRIYLYVCT